MPDDDINMQSVLETFLEHGYLSFVDFLNLKIFDIHQDQDRKSKLKTKIEQALENGWIEKETREQTTPWHITAKGLAHLQALKNRKTKN